MFETLSDRLGAILDKLTSRGSLSETDVAGAMREVVLGASPGATLSQRAVTELAHARDDLSDFARRGGTVVSRGNDGRLRWWTWAGGGANISLAAALSGVADGHGRVELHFFHCTPVDPGATPQEPFRWVPDRSLAGVEKQLRGR